MNQEQFEKELKMKDEEYNILKVTSEQIEEDQRREIYELQQRINKALEKMDTNIFYEESESIETIVNRVNEKLNEVKKILKDEEDMEVEE